MKEKEERGAKESVTQGEGEKVTVKGCIELAKLFQWSLLSGEVY